MDFAVKPGNQVAVLPKRREAAPARYAECAGAGH